MPSPPRTTRLAGNPRRQAQAPFRGYYYQLWRSVLQWTRLTPNERLHLEGAEDYVTTYGQRAIAVQVKTSQRPLTLRSRSVLDALANYLENVTKNPSFLIRYQFITTAQGTAEVGEPFGGEGGLSYWMRTAQSRDEEAASRIGHFLLTCQPAPELQSFLESASRQEVLERLIVPVAWLTSDFVLVDLEEAVFESLIYHGERHRVPPAASKRAVGRLLQEAARAIIDPEKPALTRANFLEFFEDDTSERIPRGALTSRLNSSVTLDPTSRLLESFEIAIEQQARVQNQPPRIGFEPLVRGELTDAAVSLLKDRRGLIIQGSTGTGKTLLAREVVQSFGDTPLIWAFCGGMDAAPISSLIMRIRDILHSEAGPGVVVLDDVRFDDLLAWQQLSGLQAELFETGWLTVITTARTMPASEVRRLGGQAPATINVPPFTNADIYALALALGCGHAVATEWQGVIYLKTSGHPQLVHAVLDNLANHQWPPPEKDTLFYERSDITKERSEVRLLLAQQISPQQLDLIYTLSVFGSSFRRDQALALADLSPTPLRNPGDCFDSLVGPWIERISGDYYRLSPLLDDAAKAAWSRASIAEVKKGIGFQILRTGAIGAHQVVLLLSHALEVACDEVVQGLCIGLLLGPASGNERVPQLFEPLVAIGRKESGLSQLSSRSALLLRVAQVRIATALRRDDAARIVAQWKHELGKLGDPVEAARQHYYLAGEVITRHQIPIPADEALSYLVEFYHLAAEGPPETRDAGVAFAMSAGLESISDLLGFGFPLVAIRCKDAGDVAALLTRLDKLPGHLRELCLKGLGGSAFIPESFVATAWFGEAQKKHPDWPLAQLTLRTAVDLGVKWGLVDFSAAAYAGLAVVSSEYLDDEDTAFSHLDAACELVGDSWFLRHRRAMVYYVAGDYQRALEIWRQLFQAHSKEDRLAGLEQTLLIYRTAGIAAAKLEQWTEAAELFCRGAASAGSSFRRRFSTGLRADAAYALFRGKRCASSVRLLSEALAETESWGEDMDVDERITKRLVGHVILWINTRLAGVVQDSLGEPVPGMCGSPDLSDEIANLRPVPGDLLWLDLCIFERLISGRGELWSASANRLHTSPYPYVRMMASVIELEAALDLANLSEVPFLIQRLDDSAGQSRSADVPLDPLVTDSECTRERAADLSTPLLAAALFIGSMRQAPLEDLLDDWRERSRVLPGKNCVYDWLDKVVLLLESSIRDLCIVLESGDDKEKIIAATLLANEDRLEPKLRLVVHCRLLIAFAGSAVSRVVGPVLSRLFTQHWMRHTDTPSTLLRPFITVAPIHEACSIEVDDMSKAARIVLAAEASVYVRLEDDLRQYLWTIASRPGRERELCPTLESQPE